MKLNEICDNQGATKDRKRLGRGAGSGTGKTSGRGHKGQKSRAGATINGFEGGQMPLARRLPKRGFTPRSRVEYAIVNIGQLEEGFDANTEIDIDVLRAHGMIKKGQSLLKILGDGELTRPLTIRAHKFSKSALERITAAGGQAERVEG